MSQNTTTKNTLWQHCTSHKKQQQKANILNSAQISSSQCPLWAAIQAVHRALIEATSLSIVSWGMMSHSAASASRSCAAFVGWGCLFCRRLPSSSHKCSIGAKSGDMAGQCNTSTPLVLRNCWVMRAECGLALSCCRWKPSLPCMNGSTTGRRTWSMYPCAVRPASPLPTNAHQSQTYCPIPVEWAHVSHVDVAGIGSQSSSLSESPDLPDDNILSALNCTSCIVAHPTFCNRNRYKKCDLYTSKYGKAGFPACLSCWENQQG